MVARLDCIDGSKAHVANAHRGMHPYASGALTSLSGFARCARCPLKWACHARAVHCQGARVAAPPRGRKGEINKNGTPSPCSGWQRTLGLWERGTSATLAVGLRARASVAAAPEPRGTVPPGCACAFLVRHAPACRPLVSLRASHRSSRESTVRVLRLPARPPARILALPACPSGRFAAVPRCHGGVP